MGRLIWSVDRRTLSVLVIAALAVLAIGLVAATLTSTVDPGADGEPSETPVGNETGEEEFGGAPDMPAFLRRLVAALGAVVATVTVGYVLVNPRKGSAMVAALVLAIALVFIALQFPNGLQEAAQEPIELLPGEGNETSGGQNDAQNDSSGPSPVLLAAVLGGLLIAMVLVLRRVKDEEDDEKEETGGTGSTEDDAVALGEIAGRAADRIEDGPESADEDAQNEVYRAWREMTRQLDIENAETTTPREFQQRAADAGMASEDVRELTGLFEEVRYGGESATEDREQRAVGVLRRIESTYGEET
jgi:hypothetical protein